MHVGPEGGACAPKIWWRDPSACYPVLRAGKKRQGLQVCWLRSTLFLIYRCMTVLPATNSTALERAFMNDLSIRLIKNRKELEKLLKIRGTVFIKEQKVPHSRERDGLEEESKHFIVHAGSKCIGGARVRFIRNKAKLERIVLLRSYRGKGVGTKLVRHLISYARRRGVEEIVVHGQVESMGFHEKCGLKKRGRMFVDGGIKHYEFFMKL